jgi:helicase MOV-10
VRSTLLGTSRPSPYIVFGLSGTGKTVALVESTLQLKRSMTGSYICVCASANAACDILAQKLIQHCTTHELLRLYSSSRDWASIPGELHDYRNYHDGECYFSNKKKLAKNQLISKHTDQSATQLHRQGEEPTVKGAYIMKMITTPTHLRAAQ